MFVLQLQVEQCLIHIVFFYYLSVFLVFSCCFLHVFPWGVCLLWFCFKCVVLFSLCV